MGAHPLFLVTARVEGACETLTPLIQVSRDGWKTVERSWSQKDSALGWRTEGSEAEMAIAFRPPEGLDEDGWQWRARVVANGVATESQRPSAFRVDVTPPAEIEGLHLQRRSDGAVLLRWDAVTVDVEGRPEIVDHYSIYRYDRRGTFPQGPLVKIGESRAPAWIDRGASGAKDRTAGLSLAPEAVPGAARDGGGGQAVPNRSSQEGEAPPVRPPALTATKESDTGSGERATGSGARGKASAGSRERGASGQRPAPAAAATIYYKIVAVDVAGNELGMREGAVTTSRTTKKKQVPVRR